VVLSPFFPLPLCTHTSSLPSLTGLLDTLSHTLSLSLSQEPSTSSPPSPDVDDRPQSVFARCRNRKTPPVCDRRYAQGQAHDRRHRRRHLLQQWHSGTLLPSSLTFFLSSFFLSYPTRLSLASPPPALSHPSSVLPWFSLFSFPCLSITLSRQCPMDSDCFFTSSLFCFAHPFIFLASALLSDSLHHAPAPWSKWTGSQVTMTPPPPFSPTHKVLAFFFFFLYSPITYLLISITLIRRRKKFRTMDAWGRRSAH